MLKWNGQLETDVDVCGSLTELVLIKLNKYLEIRWIKVDHREPCDVYEATGFFNFIHKVHHIDKFNQL